MRPSPCKAETPPLSYIIKQMNDSYDMQDVDMSVQESGKCVLMLNISIGAPQATDLYALRPH